MRVFSRCSTLVACALPMVCGLAAGAHAAVNDSAVHVPPFYDSLMPPEVGTSYVDPVYGTTIRRLSEARITWNNAVPGWLSFVTTEYPTASPFNANGTLVIVQHQGYFGIYIALSSHYLRDLPFDCHAGAEPRWSRTDPRVLYYVSGNQLRKLDVVSNRSTLVRAFPEYSAITGHGESDISQDDDHFVLAGVPVSVPAVGDDIFVYERSTNTKGPVLNTQGNLYNQLYIAPDNSVLIGWLPTGTARFSGIELFDPSMIFKRQVAHAIGHMHLTRDTNGDNLLIWNNSNDPLPIANCQNGIVKVRLADGQQTCLLQLDWSLAVHITAGDGNGWTFVETYAPSNPIPASPAWKPYTNELLQVKLDGTQVQRLLHHRSRPFNSYVYQPRAAASRGGNQFIFTSNYALQETMGYPSDYTDVFYVRLSVPPPVVNEAARKAAPARDASVAGAGRAHVDQRETEKASTQIQEPAEVAP